jgi:hypothetical protein
MGQPSEAARDFLSGKALSARLANTPPFIALDTRTVQQLAAGRTVCMHEVYKAQAKAAADAQEHRGNSTSSRVLTMLPHHGSTTTPVAWRNMLEVFKAFYPGAAADLDWYAQFMERFSRPRVHAGVLHYGPCQASSTSRKGSRSPRSSRTSCWT